MRKLIGLGAVVAFAAMVALGGAAHAGKPQEGGDGPFLGNGFPSGPHHNLLIHGKNDDFVCPAAKFFERITFDSTITEAPFVGDLVKTCPDGDTCEPTDIEYFGNVINVPRNGERVEILASSGKKGPKGKPTITDLEVTDWCTKPFDSDAAVFRLPKDEDGFAVYGRVQGKPTGDPTFEFTDRDLFLVEDEEGNDLKLLGLVTETGTWICDEATEEADATCILTRTSTGGRGNGVKKATDMTAIFKWSGNVCYFDELDCPNSDNCEFTQYCCPDDGTECVLKSDAMFFDVTDVSQNCSVADVFEGVTWTEEDLFCSVISNEWIFNIADFVDVLFGVKNDGSYNVQLRFYPLPLN